MAGNRLRKLEHDLEAWGDDARRAARRTARTAGKTARKTARSARRTARGWVEEGDAGTPLVPLLLGGLAVAAVLLVLGKEMPQIQRYLKMERM